jgi:hypothetical protein
MTHALTSAAPAPPVVPAPPRWAVIAAWAVPLCVLPSAVWRLAQVGDVDSAGWYLALLSVLSLALASLTLGLVQRWGEWFPPRLVSGLATTGAALLTGLCLYLALNAAFGLVERGPVLIGRDDVAHPPPGADVLVWYLPLLLWAPLVGAVTWDFRRRHRVAARS